MIHDLSVLLPALNEELTIGKVIDEALAAGVSPEHIIVGDNGSTDRTASIATSKRATVILIPDQGKGTVMRELVRHIRTPYVLTVDSDLTYPLQDNIELMRLLLDKYEAVLTYRQSEDGAMTTLHRVGNTALTLLTNLLYLAWIRDASSGMWAIRTEVLDRIEIGAGGFTAEVDLVTGVLHEKARIAQIPVQYRPRPEGSKPKLHALHAALIAIRTIQRRLHWKL